MNKSKLIIPSANTMMFWTGSGLRSQVPNFESAENYHYKIGLQINILANTILYTIIKKWWISFVNNYFVLITNTMKEELFHFDTEILTIKYETRFGFTWYTTVINSVFKLKKPLLFIYLSIMSQAMSLVSS